MAGSTSRCLRKTQAATIPQELADELGIRSDYTDVQSIWRGKTVNIDRYSAAEEVERVETYDPDVEGSFDEVDVAVMQRPIRPPQRDIEQGRRLCFGERDPLPARPVPAVQR